MGRPWSGSLPPGHWSPDRLAGSFRAMCSRRFLSPAKGGSRFGRKGSRRSPFDYDCAKGKGRSPFDCDRAKDKSRSFDSLRSLRMTS